MGYNIREIRDSTGHLLVTVDMHGNIVTVPLDPPAAPTLGAVTAGFITGTGYQWACTLVNAQGETTLGTKTAATALTAQQQSLTMPATAPDGCTFNLYRNASSGADWFQVATGLAPGAAYVDDTLDGSLETLAPTANTTAPSLHIAGGVAVGQTITSDNSLPGGFPTFLTLANGGVLINKATDDEFALRILLSVGSSGAEVTMQSEDLGIPVWRVLANGSELLNGSIAVNGQPSPGHPVLATGAGHTVDDVITLLQSIGFCKQS